MCARISRYCVFGTLSTSGTKGCFFFSTPVPTNKTELAGEKKRGDKRVWGGRHYHGNPSKSHGLNPFFGNTSATMSTRLRTFSSGLHLNSTKEDGESRDIVNGEMRYTATCRLELISKLLTPFKKGCISKQTIPFSLPHRSEVLMKNVPSVVV